MKKIIINNEAMVSAKGKFNSKHCTPIMMLKANGSELHSFTSVWDAAKELDTTPSYISACMSHGSLCKGYIVFKTKDAPAYIDKIMHCFNANADDAKQYKRIKAEEDAVRIAEERRIEEERKARERHEAAVAKAEAKIAKASAACLKYQEKLNAAMIAFDEANQELEALLDNNVGTHEN